VTGLLEPPKDVSALRSALEHLLSNPAKLTEMAVHCRRIAIEEYGLDLQARRYAKLYGDMVRSKAAQVPVIANEP
jgi:glycosyltransferase involved in cell wall biosynthesis